MRPFAVLTLLAALVPGATAAPPPFEADEAVVRRLVAALQDPDLEVRQNLGAALARVGPSAVEPLVAALRDDLPARRAGAAYALGLVGAPARSALPALLDALTDRDAEVRRQVSWAIGRLIPAGRPAAPRTPVVARPGDPP